jgi:hypothetical protein
MTQTTRPPRPGFRRPLLAALLAAAALASGCTSLEERRAAVHGQAMALASALVQRQPEAIADLFPTGAAPCAAMLATGPVVFRAMTITAVTPPPKGGEPVWRADYEATISDYPSALFNMLVRPELLGESHRLKPYETLATLHGRISFHRQDGAWRALDAGAEHQPLGRACALARAMAQWHGELAESARGAAAYVRLLALYDATYEPNHAGALTRAEALTTLSDKLERAAVEGGAAVLQERFLPAGDETVSGALGALTALDRLLAAWWRGEIEEAADLLIGVGGDPISIQELSRSPVRLHSYQITGLDAQASDRYAVTVRLALSELAAVFAAAAAPDRIPDAEGYLRAASDSMEADDVVFVARHGGTWRIECDAEHGGLGYLVQVARSLRSLRILGALPADETRFKLSLALRLTLLHGQFKDLQLGAVRSRLEDGDTLVRSVLEQIVGANGGHGGHTGLQALERCYLLGQALGQYAAATALDDTLPPSGADKLASLVAGLRRQILDLFRSLLPESDLAEYERLLVSAQLVSDPGGLLEISATLGHRLSNAYGPEHGDTYMLGFAVSMAHFAAMTGELPDDEIQDQVRDWQRMVFGHLDHFARRLPGIRPEARATITRLEAQVRGGGLVPFEEMEPMQSFDWFFDRVEIEGGAR